MRSVIFPILIAAAVTACAQPTNTTSKEKSMLNEIYATKITDIATQRADVGSIVSKYLPVGTSRNQTQAFLKSLGEGKIEESTSQIVYTTRQGEGSKGNRRDVLVKIQFGSNNNIESLTSHIDKSNNL